MRRRGHNVRGRVREGRGEIEGYYVKGRGENATRRDVRDREREGREWEQKGVCRT